MVTKFPKEVANFIRYHSKSVTDKDGRRAHYIPFWFLETGGALLFDVRSFDGLPKETIDAINEEKDGH
jgi:hypothetical protein